MAQEEEEEQGGSPLGRLIEQWQPLLRILALSPSPVGAALRWVRSSGRDRPHPLAVAPLASLWRFVPDLLLLHCSNTLVEVAPPIRNPCGMDLAAAGMRTQRQEERSKRPSLGSPNGMDAAAGSGLVMEQAEEDRERKKRPSLRNPNRMDMATAGTQTQKKDEEEEEERMKRPSLRNHNGMDMVAGSGLAMEQMQEHRGRKKRPSLRNPNGMTMDTERAQAEQKERGTKKKEEDWERKKRPSLKTPNGTEMVEEGNEEEKEEKKEEDWEGKKRSSLRNPNGIAMAAGRGRAEQEGKEEDDWERKKGPSLRNPNGMGMATGREQEEEEKEENRERKKGRKRSLPILAAEASLFRSKDLCLLAQSLLALTELDFWVRKAAKHLLTTVASRSEQIGAAFVNTENERDTSLPAWLQSYKEEHSSSSQCWLSRAYNTFVEARKTDTILSLRKDDGIIGDHLEDRSNLLATSSLDQCGRFKTQADNVIMPTSPLIPVELPLVQTPDIREADVQEVVVPCQNMENVGETLVGEMLLQVESLREALMESQPDWGKVNMGLFHMVPDLTALFAVVKPWDMEDAVILSLVENLLSEDGGGGYVWWTHVIRNVLFPKVLSLETPASRLLMTAVLNTSKTHPRALVDALLLPLILLDHGPNTSQCDIINRVVKDGLSAEYICSFIGKIFLQERRQKLQGSYPIHLDQSYLTRALVLSESICVVIQNLLSHKIVLEQEIVDALLYAIDDSALALASSLKFVNLLLALISRHGPQVKCHRILMQRAIEKTNTFMTKVAIAKLAAL